MNFLVVLAQRNPESYGLGDVLTKRLTPPPMRPSPQMEAYIDAKAKELPPSEITDIVLEKKEEEEDAPMDGQEPVAEEVFEERVEEQEAPSNSSGKTIVCLDGCVCGLHALYQPDEGTSALSLSSGIDSERLENSFLDYDMMEKINKNQDDMGDAILALQEDVKVLVENQKKHKAAIRTERSRRKELEQKVEELQVCLREEQAFAERQASVTYDDMAEIKKGHKFL